MKPLPFLLQELLLLPLLICLLQETKKLKSDLGYPEVHQGEEEQQQRPEVEDKGVGVGLEVPDEVSVPIFRESQEPDEGADGEIERPPGAQHPEAGVPSGDQESSLNILQNRRICYEQSIAEQCLIPRKIFRPARRLAPRRMSSRGAILAQGSGSRTAPIHQNARAIIV